MSFLAKLSFDGTNYYNVLEAEFEVTQQVGRSNLPNRTPEIGLIHLVVESSTGGELFEWGLAGTLTKNGSLTFISRDYSDTLKTLEFDNAFCIGYKETFRSDGSLPMKTSLTISPHRIRMHGIELCNPWGGFSASSDSSTATTTSPQHAEESDSDISSFRP